MDRLDSLSVAEGAPAVWVGVIAEDAATVNDEIFVVIPDYDINQQFGPVKFTPQALRDGSGVLLPTRGDWCLVSFDQDDNAQLMAWRADDPT
jgi:hypothetical protein